MKVIVVGLDGISKEVLDIFSDYMPNIQDLRNNWGLNYLNSVFPTNSISAWTSFATGKLPVNHGLFDFFKADNRNTLVNLENLYTFTIWEFLSHFNKTVTVINQPGSFPVRPINGKLISGMLASTINKNSVYPENLLTIIKKKFPNYKIDIGWDDFEGEFFNREKLLDELIKTTKVRFELAKFLFENNSSDYFELIFTNTDRILHYYYDVILKLNDNKMNEELKILKDKIIIFFNNLDTYLKFFIDKINSDTALIILSDHGFHPVSRVFQINRWLIKEGYLKLWSWKKLHLIVKIINKLENKFLKTRSFLDQYFQKSGIYQNIPVKWYETKAFVTSTTSEGIFINFGPERTWSGVNNHQEKELIIDEIIEKLTKLIDPGTGKKVFHEIIRCKEFISGKYIELFPEIILKNVSEDYYLSNSYKPGQIFEDLGRRSGEHSIRGVFIAGGGVFKKFEEDEFNILDVFPTITALMDLPVPDCLDGNVILKKMNKHTKQKTISESKIKFNRTSSSELDDEERYNRLKGIGYIQ